MGSGGRARLTLSYVVLLAAFGVGLRVVQLQLSLRAAQADLETTEHRCKRIATHSRFVDGGRVCAAGLRCAAGASPPRQQTVSNRLCADQIKDTLGDISATQQILEADEQRAHGVQFRSNVMGQGARGLAAAWLTRSALLNSTGCSGKHGVSDPA